MESDETWVVLLDSDEDDFLFWQYGFNLWAAHLTLKWFESPEDFLAVIKAPALKPAALIMDGVVPRGQELSMLKAFLNHPDVKGVGIFMLSQQFIEHEHQAFLDMGATDHLIKPNNHEELKDVVLRVSKHASSYAYEPGQNQPITQDNNPTNVDPKQIDRAIASRQTGMDSSR